LPNHIVLYAKTFEREFKKLSQIDQEKVLEKIALLEEDPFYPSLRSKKIKGRPGRFESSVNMDIRIIWIYQNNKIILMLDVGHHDVLNKY